MSQLSYQFSIVTVIFIAGFLISENDIKMILILLNDWYLIKLLQIYLYKSYTTSILDCRCNAWPIRGFAVYESDDEYNTIASDVVPAADRDLLEASGPSEDKSLAEDNAPSEATDPSEDRDLPKARWGHTEDRDSTNDGASTSQV